jgi:hypothetical protein
MQVFLVIKQLHPKEILGQRRPPGSTNRPKPAHLIPARAQTVTAVCRVKSAGGTIRSNPKGREW